MHIPDIERDGHKGVQDDEVGEDLEEGQLGRSVLVIIIVVCVDAEPGTIHSLKHSRANQADHQAHSQEAKDLEGESRCGQ